MTPTLSRRELLLMTAPALAAEIAPSSSEAANATRRDPFRLCFNTSTIRGQKLPLADVVDLVAKAGYHAVEPWIDEIQAHRDAGHSLADLRKRIADHGLTVESGIGFAEWIVDDSTRRAKGLEQARRDFDLLAQIGGKHLAAPPMGATEQTNLSLRQAAERYHALGKIGDEFGVIPMVEVWGFSQSLTRLAEAAHVAIESGYERACVLADVYHLHKGGSDWHGLNLLRPAALPVLHLNDYPASPPPETITDADRVYPGEGVAPIAPILRLLRANLAGSGGQIALSLELFREDLYRQDPLAVAKTGLEKMRSLVQQSLA